MVIMLSFASQANEDGRECNIWYNEQLPHLQM